jgi:L,D-transpeptidase-like protein
MHSERFTRCRHRAHGDAILEGILCLIFFVCAMPAAVIAATQVDAAHLKPGEYLWHPELAPAGPVVAVVSLDEQHIYVYRNGIAIGLATISSGRRGHETPPGIYTILGKDRDHHSNLYDNAPMPFMERLTWGGVALHGGTLPGYPASHGCVRLPKGFAQALFAITQRGDTVIVAKDGVSPINVVHPAVLSPASIPEEPAGEPPTFANAWDSGAAAEGPVSILVSLHDRMAYVLRNGLRIGSSAVDVADGFAISGTMLLVVGEGFDDEAPSRLDPSRARHRWSVYPVRTARAAPTLEALGTHLHVPQDFAKRIYALLTPGTTVVVTDLPGVRDPDEGRVRPVLESATR